MQGDEERQRLLPPTMVAGHSLSDLGLAPEPGRGRGASCRRRYLALVLFSWFAFSQGLARSISLAMEDDLVVKNTNRLLLSSWSAVGFLAFPVLMYLMDKHGLRTSLIAALFALLLGSGLRCIPSAPPGAQTWLVHSSQLLIAIAGPSAIAAAPFISSTWFPQDERSIATAIGALANYLGAASAFLMQSFLIDSGNGLATRGGLKLLSHRSMETIIFNRMQIMLYVEFGMIAVLFVLVVLLMPRHPLLYPSTSAATRRLHYTEAIPRLLRRPSFWLAVAVYAFPLGVSSAWLKQLGSMFKLHFSSTVVGWAELAAVLAGYLGALAVARCSDNFTGRLKVIVLTLLSGATLSAVWFTISCLGKISFLALSTVNLLVTCVLFGAFMVGAIPLLLELLVEVTFPVPEGLSCGLAAFVSIACITLPINVVAASSLDLTWLSWALVGGCALGALGILLLPESYGRLHMDVILSV